VHPLFDPCYEALLKVTVFVPLVSEPGKVRPTPHRDRELREIGELPSQIRKLLVHVTSLHPLLECNDSAGHQTLTRGGSNHHQAH
jgi:hypothetical protein